MNPLITQQLKDLISTIEKLHENGNTKDTMIDLDFITIRDAIISCLINVEEDDWEQLQLALLCYLPHIALKYNDKP